MSGAESMATAPRDTAPRDTAPRDKTIFKGAILRLKKSINIGANIMYISIKDSISWQRIVVMGIFAAIPIIIVVYLAGKNDVDTALLSDLYLNYHIQLMALLLSVIYASSLINEDISTGKIMYYTTRYANRVEYNLYKYLSYITYAPWPTVVSAVLCYFAALESAKFSGDTALLFSYIAGIVIATAAYGALFSFMGVVFRKPHIPALLVAFIWENIISRTTGKLPKISIMYHIRALIRNYVSAGSIGRYAATSPGKAMATIFAIIFAFIALSMLLLARKELYIEV